MTFDEFQNCARLYVIGALYPDEIPDFEKAAAAFGSQAQRYIRDCCNLRDAFAMSLRPPGARESLGQRVLSMARHPKTT